ncbi:sialidase family protein [Streptomyces sp. NPDC051940]|uniref:sialidase family protein n=1 Tax=Streptomyces sp. NPDC051940 TaxID=3155675 RepID=UPI00343C1A50
MLPAGTSTAAAADEAAATPLFEQQVLFKGANEQGYACFRIPAVTKAADGTLLAFAEGRVNNCGDAGDIDLVLKRSADGGRTWSPLQVIREGNGDTVGNPVPIVDGRTGRITLISTRNKGVGSSGNCPVPCERLPYVQHSSDNGRTWTAERPLGAQATRPDWNAWYASGPVHGIQLTKGPHAGRMVFGINAETWDATASRISYNHAGLVYSDDGGDTWRIGAVDTFPIRADGTFSQKPSEMTLLERADGSIYVNGREQDGTDLGHRDRAVSRDGGETFAQGFTNIPDLHTPQVQGSTIRLRSTARDGYSRVLFSGPADPDRRRTMMIRSSYDEGRTWEGADRGRVVTTDWSGYSDLVNVDDDTVGLMYEGGPVDARDEIRFVRFDEAWLGGRRAPDPVTADLGPGARPALVLGGAQPTDGRFGGGLALDGVDDHVRLPHRDSLPLDDSDFTAGVWFRYTATSGEQPLLWMGGVGNRSPYVALRALPAEGRVVAELTVAPAGPVRVPLPVVRASSTGAYNDGRWHHAVVRRGGGQVTLTVDGTSFTAPDVAGSVSRNSTFGVHLGQKVDGRIRFAGALDEVRVYDRRLTDAEVAALSADNATGGSLDHDVVLRLPLDAVDAP